MKTTKFFSALALIAFFFHTTLSAHTTTRGGVTFSTSAKSVVINLGDVLKEVIDVKIVDDGGNILLNETVKNVKGFTKKYNMARLQNGQYSIVITKKTIRTVQPFTIENGELKMSTMDKKEQFLPSFNFRNNRLDVNVLLQDYDKISVKLFDNEGHQLIDDSHNAVFQLQRRYDLSKLSQGVYIVEIVTSAETFTYNIVK